MNKTFLLTITTLLFSVLWLAPAQDTTLTHPDETKAEIPALDNFHDIIYKIWHTAWPEKNVKMLAELEPEIQQYAKPLIQSELPGILRDKKTLWKENISKFQNIIEEYKKSSMPVDSQRLLASAEQLHTQYEKLVRIIRPALKELDEFHSVLYMLYHYYLPEKNIEKIVVSTNELKIKMENLDKAKLSERLKKKETMFIEARTHLSKSVVAVQAVVISSDMKKISSAIETMHSDYQALEKVFE
ncbi:MAG: hypothetical protein EPO24_12440 [Bacteroidetes bacterium]|nr:MAG: hypothetical protein EPO24_12440 [Bacteroidota bacterium]